MCAGRSNTRRRASSRLLAPRTTAPTFDACLAALEADRRGRLPGRDAGGGLALGPGRAPASRGDTRRARRGWAQPGHADVPRPRRARPDRRERPRSEGSARERKDSGRPRVRRRVAGLARPVRPSGPVGERPRDATLCRGSRPDSRDARARWLRPEPVTEAKPARRPHAAGVVAGSPQHRGTRGFPRQRRAGVRAHPAAGFSRSASAQLPPAHSPRSTRSGSCRARSCARSTAGSRRPTRRSRRGAPSTKRLAPACSRSPSGGTRPSVSTRRIGPTGSRASR